MKKKIPGVHAEEIKHDLFEKITEYYNIIEERDAVEEEIPPEVSYNEFAESNDEYAGLCHREMLLQDEIDELMLETKYVPLMNLDEEQMKRLGKFEKLSNLNIEIIIEKHMDGLLNEMKIKMRSRIKKIKPLRTATFLDAKTRGIYHEIISCFIFGNLAASCALCRSLAEYLVLKLIDFKGYGDLITGKEKRKDGSGIQKILHEYKLISDKAIEHYTEIYDKGSDILHISSMVKDENEVSDFIRKLQVFIKEVKSG